VNAGTDDLKGHYVIESRHRKGQCIGHVTTTNLVPPAKAGSDVHVYDHPSRREVFSSEKKA
jgi:hypothetical protein